MTPSPAFPLLLASLLILSAGSAGATPLPGGSASRPTAGSPSGNSSAVANLTAALNRLVTLLGASGAAVLSLVWARVALSWFTNDVGKKIQAKERARDALVGTLLFVAALTGLLWALARWVLTGS